MVELLTMLMHMLDLARASAAAHGAAQQLHQLVLVLADGRFHEKDSLRRMVMVRPATAMSPACGSIQSAYPTQLHHSMPHARGTAHVGKQVAASFCAFEANYTRVNACRRRAPGPGCCWRS
jgi:hypothetical protein